MIIDNLLVGNQPSFQSLRHLFKVLERNDFMELASHILKGDQVIVRGSDVTTVTSIIYVLKVHYPSKLLQFYNDSSMYV